MHKTKQRTKNEWFVEAHLGQVAQGARKIGPR
jgi:hypothetical protein